MAITKEEIFQLFGETNRLIQENAQKSKDLWHLFEETDRRLQEVARRQEETDRQMKETDCQIKQMTKSIGQLGNRLGQFVEKMVKPAVMRLFRERGIDVHHVYPRASASYEDDAMEVDLLVVNVETAILVEAKSELKADDVREHLDRLARFKKLFPAFQNHRVIGAVAAMVVSDETARYAYRQGLFVLGQSGEAMTLRNDDSFEPKIW